MIGGERCSLDPCRIGEQQRASNPWRGEVERPVGRSLSCVFCFCGAKDGAGLAWAIWSGRQQPVRSGLRGGWGAREGEGRGALSERGTCQGAHGMAGYGVAGGGGQPRHKNIAALYVFWK